MVEDIAVIGDEAFINPTESKELTLGYYLSKDLDLFHVDFGIRHDQISRNGSVSHDEHDEDHDEHEEDRSMMMSMKQSWSILIGILILPVMP